MFISRLSTRLSGEKPEPKPYYYNRMNPEEMQVWHIIVRIFMTLSNYNRLLTVYRVKKSTNGFAIARAGYTNAT
jgi:hypothetical protein